MKTASIPALLKKDSMIFFRSKISSILIILIPLIIILAAGYALNSSNLSNVYVGVHFNSSSELTQKIVSGFQDNGFLVKNYDSAQDCIDSVKLDSVQICAVFSKDDSTNSSRDAVNFYVDYSKINLAGTLVNNAENTVYNESAAQGRFHVQDLIDIIDLTKENVPKAQTSLNSAYSKISSNKETVNSLNLSTDNFDSALSYLESAKTLSNDSTQKTDITNAINVISALKNNTEKISVNLEGVLSTQDEALQGINSSSDNLNSIETKANSGDVGSAETIVSPIKISVEPITQNSTNRDYFIPILISLITLFGALLLSSTFVLKEKRTLAYFRNFMTPTKSATFLFSTYLTCLIILVAQFILVFLGIQFILGINSFSISPELISIMLLSFSVFIFIGMFIGYIFRSEESVIFASMITGGVFLFFSNTILPIENVSANLMNLSFLNPLILLDSALKKVMTFGLTFSSISWELIFLGWFFVFFALMTYFARRITRRML